MQVLAGGRRSGRFLTMVEELLVISGPLAPPTAAAPAQDGRLN